MSDPTATFGIQIPVDTNADGAATSVESLRDQITQSTQAIRGMKAAMRDLQGGTNVDIAAFRQLRDAVAAETVSRAKATQQLAKQKDAFKFLTPEQAKATKGTKEYRLEQERLAKLGKKEFESGLAHALGVLSPRLGHAVRGLQDFSQSAKAMGAVRGIAVGASLGIAAAFAGTAAASIALTYAVGRAVKSLIEFGIAAADARRDERLMLQAASATLWWGQATEQAGKQAQMAVDNVASHVPIARAEVAGYAAQLAKAQLKGQDLQKALKAVSIAASAGQDTGGVIGAFMMASRFGAGSIDAVADRIEKKFGGVVRERMLSLGVQTMKLKENLAGLFSKVNPTPFLEAIQKIFAIFDKTSVTGYVLTETFGTLFNVLGHDAKTAAPFFETAIKLMVNAMLRGTLAALKFRNTVADFLDEHPRLTKFFGDIDTYVTTLSLSFDFLGTVIKTAFGPIGDAVSALKTLYDLISGSSDLGKSGESLGDDWAVGVGIGIERKTEDVIGKVKELGARGVKALRDAWGVHSPSTVAADIMDRGVGEGAVRGLDRAKDRVQNATASTFNPSAAGGGSSPSSGGGGITLHIHVTVPPGTKDPEAFGRKVGLGILPYISAAFENAAHMLGATLEVA